jgi:hypothetical protein
VSNDAAVIVTRSVPLPGAVHVAHTDADSPESTSITGSPVCLVAVDVLPLKLALPVTSATDVADSNASAPKATPAGRRDADTLRLLDADGEPLPLATASTHR